MRRSSVVLFFAIVLMISSSAFLLYAQEKKAESKSMTITGTLVDLACYAKGGFTTNDHGSVKNCGSACVAGGQPVGLLDAGKKVHFLGVAAAGYAEYVGKELRLTGTHGQHADVFFPEKMEVKEGDKWLEKKLPKGMM